MNSRSTWIHCAFLALLLSLPQLAHASSTREAEIDAATDAAREIDVWWEKLPGRPKSVGIVDVQVSDKLAPNYSGIVEALLVEKLSKYETRVVPCYACRSPQVEVKGDQLVISKGLPDHHTLVEMATVLEVESFMTVSVTKTSFAVTVQVTLVQVPTGTVIAARTFRIPCISREDVGLMVLVTGGFRYQIDTKLEGNPHFGVDLTLYLEIDRHGGCVH